LKNEGQHIRIIISGGGTGGHIFPAISIADEIMRRLPEAELLFVGAKGRMEMERVPAAGYKIVGLPVSGIQRRLTLKNIRVVLDLLRSLHRARRLIREFRPIIAIGVGGYASGPILRAAARAGIPTLLQEQNNYAGVTNKILAMHAGKICVAYEGMEKYFPEEKIVVTGNPVRKMEISRELKNEGYEYFELVNDRPVVLILGGSLGARSINEAMLRNYERMIEDGMQIIWQTGRLYVDEMKQRVAAADPCLKIHAFLTRVDLAYNVADLVVSRAGAISISELCLAGKVAVLIPSPNVAEDHQTKNAMALAEKEAAILLKDSDAGEELGIRTIELLQDANRCARMAANIKALAKPGADRAIVDEIVKLIEMN
jgi:UDP-N-acetylglucosamine--N-acetylmuramyl-(pentapeptide) pyrophosphoryl-undecaprenol N-acetylglucosamine transferase